MKIPPRLIQIALTTTQIAERNSLLGPTFNRAITDAKLAKAGMRPIAYLNNSPLQLNLLQRLALKLFV